MTQGLTVTNKFTLDTPELQAAGEKIKNALILAADRAVMHFAEPAKYPIDSTAGSAEQLFLAHLTSRKPAVQKTAVAKTTASLGTPARMARLGALAEVDLRSKTPVLDQAAKLFGWAPQIHAKSGAEPGPPPPPSPTAADAGNAAVRIRIRKITCVDNTDPDWGADDMIVGGSIVNDKGKSFEIGQSKIGEMEEDDKPVREYFPPRVFATCYLGAGIKGSLEASSWPKVYIATVVLCEQDNGGFPDWLGKLLEVIKDKVQAWAVTALGAVGETIGTALFPGLGTAIGAGIGALVGWLLDGIIGFFVSWWEDDVMPPVTSQCNVQGYARPGTVLTSPVLHWDIKGQGGEYKLELDWQTNFPSHFADKLDCAVNWDNGKSYFFSGTKYVRYDMNENRVDDGYPKDIADGWAGMWKHGARAGIMWNNGKAFFFKGDECVRVDAATKKVDPGYPKKIKDSWKGLWHDGIEAAVMKTIAGKAYFFKGEEYIRWDVASGRPDPGYPAPIAGNWHGSFAKNIDAAMESYNYAMIFKGNSFVRYNMVTNQAETGASETDFYWPGL